MKNLKVWLKTLVAGAKATGLFLLSPSVWFFISLFGGYGLLTFGIFLKFGIDLAVICAALCCFSFAFLAYRGMTRG